MLLKKNIQIGKIKIVIFLSILLLSLLFFNIGIELAQIALIPIPLFFIYLSKRFDLSNHLKILASYSIGGMGFYWFIDRVIGMIQ